MPEDAGKPCGYEQRLAEAAREAHAAQECGDDATANEAWRRYRLIVDGAREPDDLLRDGIALSDFARQFAAESR